jgi:CRISPR-associated endonuclease/helicase Cas3
MPAYYGETDGCANAARPYQQLVAEKLSQRRNVVLTAPTGAGKTLAVLAPFMEHRERIGVRRLIYCLPMKTLAEGIFAEAQALVARLDRNERVTIQTGERPEDPFFLGDIVVCTYDQFLSGLLCGPYSLSSGLHNINAAAAMGNLVVFDEFHLMEVNKAFLTAIALLRIMDRRTLSVWMTATATEPLKEHLIAQLGAIPIELTPAEMTDSAGLRRRRFVKRDIALSAKQVIEGIAERRLVVVNTVGRAQEIFRDLLRLSTVAGVSTENVFLLHSRFFATDREAKRRRLYELFGKRTPPIPAVVVSTQVVEAGLDISAERLLTDLCPMNSLLQRAGRCARFADQTGIVEVYRGPDLKEIPYQRALWNCTWNVLEECEDLPHARGAEWINRVHRESDAELLRDMSRLAECRQLIMDGVRRSREGGVSHLIRTSSSDVAVIIQREPAGTPPMERESISVRRNSLERILKGGGIAYRYDPDADSLWVSAGDTRDGYVVAVHPNFARYTVETGLELGQSGHLESPNRISRPLRPDFTYVREPWGDHVRNVRTAIREMWYAETFEGGLLDRFELERLLDWAALLHDLGKLQRSWQQWADRYERKRDPDYVAGSALAHTESQTARDREIGRASGKKPPHSEASAVYGDWLLAAEAPEIRGIEKAAILGAVASHHGGWFSENVVVDKLDRRLQTELRAAGVDWSCGRGPKYSDRTDSADLILDAARSEQFAQFWQLMSTIVRLLRLADQKATADGGNANE